MTTWHMGESGPLEATIINPTVDFSNTDTVYFYFRPRGSDHATYYGTCSVTTAEDGKLVCEYNFTTAMTATAGNYEYQFSIILPDSSVWRTDIMPLTIAESIGDLV